MAKTEIKVDAKVACLLLEMVKASTANPMEGLGLLVAVMELIRRQEQFPLEELQRIVGVLLAAEHIDVFPLADVFPPEGTELH